MAALDSPAQAMARVLTAAATIAAISAAAVATSLPLEARLAASPTCALNGTPCPPPRWTPTWNLTMSTVCQPGARSGGGYFMPPASQPWGLISLDWSVAESVWRKANQNTSTNEATSTEGCRRIKAASPGTRCFIYHNMELALQGLESQRAVMYNRSLADWFLQVTDGNGTKTGTIYNEPASGPGDQVRSVVPGIW